HSFPTRRSSDLGPVLEFIAGNGPPTRFWYRKHETLTGFYRFAIARGYVNGSPLPKNVPKLSRLFVPYIFSRVELKTPAGCGRAVFRQSPLPDRRRYVSHPASAALWCGCAHW